MKGKGMKTLSSRSAILLAWVAAFLLGSGDTSARIITVTNGDDSGPGSLRQAILDGASGDTINFATGITTVTLTSGELLVDKNLTITGLGADYLTVSRTADASLYFRIFEITSSTVATISGLTIANGSVDADHVPPGYGGGILNAGVLTLSDCTVSGNHSAGTEFVGGIGGGVYNTGTMTVTRCAISNNSAQYRAGSSGDCPTCSGGGLHNTGSMTITDSTINGNSSTASAALCFHDRMSNGAGVGNYGSVSITNCTISGNSASGPAATGGGVSNFGNLQVTSSTVVHNSVSGEYPDEVKGGGIYGGCLSATTTDSNILALNTASGYGPDLSACLSPGTVLESTGYNIIGDEGDFPSLHSQPTDQIGTADAPIDPLLEPLANNGGPTQTHALQSDSPAIEHGDPAAPQHDQRGYNRVEVPDVGAFEFGGTTPATLGNISTRSFVQTGDNVMIGGFIVQGAGAKRLIIRASGPDLSDYGVPNPLQDPTLELRDGTGALIASNDNWQTTIIGGIVTHDQVEDIQDSGYAPGDPYDSVIIADLPVGNYTAVVRGCNNATGVALVEVYDIDSSTSSVLGNISTRSFVQRADNVMSGGFIVQGAGQKRVILRAVGLELSQYGVPNPLQNPTLELHDGTGAVIASNDDWQHTIIGGIITQEQVSDIMNSGLAPGDPTESAIIADLPPGNYTAIVSSVNDLPGIGLIEVYGVN
jgi:hypothetical protein